MKIFKAKAVIEEHLSLIVLSTMDVFGNGEVGVLYEIQRQVLKRLKSMEDFSNEPVTAPANQPRVEPRMHMPPVPRMVIRESKKRKR